MLEIVHDVAPGAELSSLPPAPGSRDRAEHRALRAAGCDIIVDDWFYFVETPFRDGQAPGVRSNTNGGIIIQAVNDVTAGRRAPLRRPATKATSTTARPASGRNFVDGGPTRRADAGGQPP